MTTTLIPLGDSMTGDTIYSAKCVRCGNIQHRTGSPIADGERVSHATSSYNHNGYTTSVQCAGQFVSMMGRDWEEIRCAEERVRAEEL